MTTPEPIVSSAPPTGNQSPTDLVSYSFPDSTDVIGQRYTKCTRLIKTIEEFADGYTTIAELSIKQYESINKSVVVDFPRFETNTATDVNAVSGSKGIATPPPSTGDVDDKIIDENTPTDLNMFISTVTGYFTNSHKRLVEFKQNIEQQVIPDLKRLHSETSKRHKQYISESQAQAKTLSKIRDITSKASSHLDAAVQEYNRGVHSSNKGDYKKDPFYIKRGLVQDAEQQVIAENNRVEYLSQAEAQFKVYEGKTIVELKRIFQYISEQLVSVNLGSVDEMKRLALVFNNVDADKEWSAFVDKNSTFLMTATTDDPASLYKRDINAVTFSNSEHMSTKPVLDGVLGLQDKLLGITKKYVNHYFVISPSGYLLCYNSRKIESHAPVFVMYLPECEVKKIGSSGKKGEFKFSLRGKDVSTLSLKPRKNHVFKAGSEQDYQTWIDTISKTVGAVQSGTGVSDVSDVES